MSGLRSYRAEETIDFSDARLMAIVGDTGAGKSSILEALFFALYGGCTWDHRAVVPLISDGCEVMQVELTFIAEGRTWKVFRAASRRGAQSRHELCCIEDPSVRFDNDGPVTTEIQRLVGLDRDAFLRTVVLPQGRFQALLQATKGDRTAILKGIFRLEQLAAVRDQADLVARRLRPRVESLKLERAALLVDPAAAFADAQDRHEQASQRRSKLRSFAERVSTASRQRDEFDRRALELESCGLKLREALLPTAADELAALAESQTRIDERREQLDVERQQRQADVNTLADVLREAEDAGEGIRELAAAASTVTSLREQMPGLDNEATGCAEEAEAVERLSQDISANEATTMALQDEAAKSQSESEEFAHTVELTNSRVERARQRLHVAREKITELSRRRDEAAKAVDRVQAAWEAVQAASADSQAATARLHVALEALAAIQHAHAAAHAAEGCQPGDPCPICDRSLPANFSAPTPPGDAEARSELANTEQAASEASRTLATRQAELASANRDRERAEKVVDEVEGSLVTALEDLRTVIPAASLDADDESILAPLITAASSAAGQYEELRSKATRLGNEAARATATLDAQRAERQRRKGQLEKRQESLRARRLACEEAAAGLPPSYRVAPPLTQTTLADAEGRIAARQEELAEVERQLARARHLVDDLGRKLDALNEELRADVEGPAQRLVPKLVILAQRHDDLAARLDLAPAAARPEGRLPDEAAWAARVQVMALAALAAGEKFIGELRAQRDEAVARISESLAGADVKDEAALNEVIIEVATLVARAKDDIRLAAEQIPRAAELDEQVVQGANLLEALDELTRLLSDSKFIGYVVARKQQALLAVASEVLGSMTGQRYGFSESFEIVDRLTGLPRGVKTLSGGETFLASLALALALVELAGRGGGRLDALFLDEGFGSLDANSLAEALDTLGRQAEAGRLVAVISHLRSVAENMEHVLAVTLGPEGSRARWIGGDERDQLIADEVEAGLLT